MANKDLTYKYIDTNSMFTKVSEMMKKEGITITDNLVEYIFRFQFDELHRQMKNKQYVSIPNIGTFGIQIWKDLLEDERCLFCIKNRKGDLGKGVYKLNSTIINHNWLFYNKARSLHSTFNDVDIYRKEVYTLFDQFKDNIITRELLTTAYIKEDKPSKIKIEQLLESTKDESTKWFTDKVDRKRKIDYHNIEGYIPYRTRKIEENRKL